MIIKRGGIYLAALDPVIGKEIAKTRPVAVISNDKNEAKADQIRTLDKSRLIKHIGELGKTEIAAIEKAIKIHLAI
jgi:mRNA interferase MazF